MIKTLTLLVVLSLLGLTMAGCNENRTTAEIMGVVLYGVSFIGMVGVLLYSIYAKHEIKY